MRFNEYKKKIEKKRQQEETLKELKSAVITITKKRDKYIEDAKNALKNGDEAMYNASAALIKSSVFNLKQAQAMLTNFVIAKDMMEMQSLNKQFVSSLDKVMKDVNKTCKAINVPKSEKIFKKALDRQSQTSLDLQRELQNNNVAFASSVNSMSDIDDEEIKMLIKGEIKKEDALFEESIGSLERMFDVKSEPSQASPMLNAMGGSESAPEFKWPFNSEESENSEEPTNPADSDDSVKKNDLDDNAETKFKWDDLPSVGFDDIAGLDEVKELVKVKVLLPLKNPKAFEGYEKKNGGGLCLYGPPGTGKTMIAAAIAKEIGAKFCSVKPSDLLMTGFGNTERAIKTLFEEARRNPCSVIYFDEMDSISPKNTRSTATRQLRSEFLAQLQGTESYGKEDGNILFCICATNKPWDIDSAFLRPGRFDTKIYVGLPDEPAREYMVRKRLDKIYKKGVVEISDDIDLGYIIEATDGFNGADITNLLDRTEESSILRGIETGEKYISNSDFEKALEVVHSSVQKDDIVKLQEWIEENDN